jgi:hypothetical protein
MKRALAAAVGVAILAFALGWFTHEAKPQVLEQRRTTTQRVQGGPYIAQSKDISTTENVRVLVIPHPLGDFFDTQCVIYTNRDVGTATMNCPNAHQGELSTPEPERR